MPSNDSSIQRYSRRHLIRGLGGAGVATLVAGCSSGTPTDAGTAENTDGPTGSDETDGTTTGSDETTAESLPEGTLTIGQAKEPIEFDPMVVNDIPSIQVLRRVFDPLYTSGSAPPPDPSTKIL